MNDPVQIDARRRVLEGNALTASTSAGSIGRPIRPSPPATSTVSTESMDAMRSVTANPVPIEVVTSRPVHRCDPELVVGAEAIGLRENLCRPCRVQQLHAVEDDDHHHARLRRRLRHKPIVSHFV